MLPKDKYLCVLNFSFILLVSQLKCKQEERNDCFNDAGEQRKELSYKNLCWKVTSSFDITQRYTEFLR